jgi:N-acetylglucosaminyldiphosphoundecaprenol N-acetyl-beta-D-mannosaminyltransferase
MTKLLGLEFNDFTLREALAWVEARDPEGPFSYVVTPNAEHIVKMASDPDLRQACEGAALKLLDSRVAQRLARAFMLEAPPVTTGSDLTAALFNQVIKPETKITILGCSPMEIRVLCQKYGLRHVAHYNPPMGFYEDPKLTNKAIKFLEDYPARFVFFAVGTPAKEMMAELLHRRGTVGGTGLCIGASLLYLTGAEKRAPKFLQKLSLEWAWRLLLNPKKMARRYLITSPKLFGLLWRAS